MRVIAAILAGAAAAVLSAERSDGSLTHRVGRYVAIVSENQPQRRSLAPEVRRRAPAVVIGAVLAGAASFTDAVHASPFLAAATGGLAGWLLKGLAADRARSRRAAALRSDVPTTADALALHVIAGASIADAIERQADGGKGPAADDLRSVVENYRSGASLPEALLAAAQAADHPDARRLYDLLSHAHTTGGRLADTLTNLSTDVRSSLARDLTAESGKRAIAAYGPILALMIPVTVLFLMYPTLVGLGALSGSATP